ncbi:CdaR family transcriptional regulator [Oceanisphaera sp. IT1-181]|uniref:CdaR family transcriptional regulator n=1 Tax=Oceanisphaera sp. IT1-181 TaxID=3081199 RepID=UPI0029CA13F0|nr:sugar diacid recognition domain-containing protein [Oceanisphaera sp. IT1-181]
MMEIEDIIAEKIIARTKGLIPYDINVMNKQGIVVASTDASRVGREHQGARWVIEHQESVTVDLADTRFLAGAKPGVNLPIEYQGNCIGVVGITGDPDRVCELGALLKMTAELLVEQSREKDAALQLRIEKENCIKQLLQGQLDETEACAQLKKLQLSLRLPALCVTMKPAYPPRMMQQKLDLTPALELALNGLFCFNSDASLSFILDANANVTAKIAETGRLLGQPFKTGIGATVTAYSTLALSQATASAALQFGLVELDSVSGDASATLDSNSYYYDSHKEKIIISSIAKGWHLSELTKEYRALCAQDANGALRLTLQTLMSSSIDMSSCAQQLNIHRNTLRNRLEKIQDITGVDYKKLDQLFRLYLGKIILD